MESQIGHDHRFDHDKRIAPMPSLDKSNIRKIKDLLTPLTGRESERRELLTSALGTDTPLLSRLDLTGPVGPFLVNMIKALVDYGEIAPGQQALWAVLQVARERVGVNHQAEIDDLYQVINALGRNDDQGHAVDRAIGSSPANVVLKNDNQLPSSAGTVVNNTIRPSCYVLMTKNQPFLKRIVDALLNNADLKKNGMQHFEPEVKAISEIDPKQREKQAEQAEQNRERYIDLLKGFFKASDASQYKWLITNLPNDQKRDFKNLFFHEFSLAEDKFCIFIESGQEIPQQWKQWAKANRCHRSFPFRVIETNHKEAAEQLIIKAGVSSVWPEDVKKKLAVLSLFPEDSSANQRALVYHKFFGARCGLHPNRRYLLNVKLSAHNFEFFRWDVKDFSVGATAAAVSKNQDSFNAAMKADCTIFLCGNDDMAEKLSKIIDEHNKPGDSRGWEPIIFGFDGLLTPEDMQNKGVRILTTKPGLNQMCMYVAEFITSNSTDWHRTICIKDAVLI